MAFGTDIIAGFPMQTDAMFARSLALVEECGLTLLHVFPFSRGRHARRAHAAGAARHRQGARQASARNG